MTVVHPIGAFIAAVVLGLVAGVYLGLILAPWVRRTLWESPGFTSERETVLELRIRAWKTLWAWETGRLLQDLARAKRAVLLLKAQHDDPADVKSADMVA